MAFKNLAPDGIALQKFIELYNETPFEIIEGERIAIMPGVARHVEIIRALSRILDQFISEHNLGEVYTEAPFVLEYKPDWVRGSRVPDLMFFQEHVLMITRKIYRIGNQNPLSLFLILQSKLYPLMTLLLQSIVK